MEISGKIHRISDAQQVTERFRKREFVLELSGNSQYPQFVQFQLSGNRCEKIDGLEVGEEVKVEFSLRGREWTSPSGDVKYFNSLDVWSIDPTGSSAARTDEPPLPSTAPPGVDDDVVF
jgi:hypothetical protein